MPSDCIPIRETNFFSPLICDYVEEKPDLQSFYHRFPKIENFQAQIEEKKASFSSENREALVYALIEQYKEIKLSEPTRSHLESLRLENTFTIVTGHQLNLFTGPLYFLYKIISTINLTAKLKKEYPEYNFVPVYWMATEDHDFEEINYFNLKGKKIQWNRNSSGPIGYLKTSGMDKVFEIFSAEIGIGQNADYLKSLFEKAYLKHQNLTEATRYLANELFGAYGLVIIDGDHKDLKRLFIPYAENELLSQTAYSEVSKSAEALEELGYGIQVNPREINLFYINEGLRERILEKEGKYYVNETDIFWEKDELLSHLKENPEKFSPNVLMRPLYQEVILPNLCYIGGGGELAYWLQLKNYFRAMEVPFPVLLLRNSALLKTEKQATKIKNLNVTDQALFLKPHELINRKVRKISNIDINFDQQKEHLISQFEGLYKIAEQTDASFINAVKAQEVKQLKGLDHLEKRLLKAQRLKLKDQVKRLSDLQNELFPQENLQERTRNFSEFYKDHGKDLITLLMKEFNPLASCFTILTLP